MNFPVRWWKGLDPYHKELLKMAAGSTVVFSGAFWIIGGPLAAGIVASVGILVLLSEISGSNYSGQDSETEFSGQQTEDEFSGQDSGDEYSGRDHDWDNPGECQLCREMSGDAEAGWSGTSGPVVPKRRMRIGFK